MPVFPISQPDIRRRLVDIATSIGTPTYVYYEPGIRSRIKLLRQSLADIPARLLYAMKANSSPAVLRVILDYGLGVDAVSMGEVVLACRLGTDPASILFSANNMTDEEMHGAHKRGVLLNIGELSRLQKYGHAYPGAKVCIRLNPYVGAGHHEHVITAGEKSKFGISVRKAGQIRDVANRHQLKIIGLHQHIGSGILDTQQLWLAISVLLEAAKDFPSAQFLNFGGGLGVPYAPDDAPIDFGKFQREIIDPLRRFSRGSAKPINFWFEPGRFLVADAGALLMRVNTLKQTDSRTFAGTDSGFNHLIRPMMYGAYHHISNLTNPDGSPEKYDIAGNICESGDLFARDRMIPQIREGDVLAVHDTGAYGMSMASEYNLRPLPAEVMITSAGDQQLVRRRESDEELVERILSRYRETPSG